MSKSQSTTRNTSSANVAKQALTTTAQGKSSNVTREQRQHMIAEAAYFRAQQRGFQYGDPQQDWLAAEAEVDQMLDSTLH